METEPLLGHGVLVGSHTVIVVGLYSVIGGDVVVDDGLETVVSQHLVDAGDLPTDGTDLLVEEHLLHTLFAEGVATLHGARQDEQVQTDAALEVLFFGTLASLVRQHVLKGYSLVSLFVPDAFQEHLGQFVFAQVPDALGFLEEVVETLFFHSAG